MERRTLPDRSRSVEALLALSIPGGTLLLVIVGTYEMARKRRGKRRGTPLSAAYVDEFTAFFYGTKRTELNHRQSVSMMREENTQGAPSRLGVDLDRGIVTLPAALPPAVAPSASPTVAPTASPTAGATAEATGVSTDGRGVPG